MNELTRWTDFFGQPRVLIRSTDSLYLVFPNERDVEGNSRVVMIPKEEFLKAATTLRKLEKESA